MILEVERDNLEQTIELGLESGECLEAVMKLDNKGLMRIYRGYLRRQEYQMNTFLQCGHTVALKIAQGVHGSEEFSDAIDSIKLVHVDKFIEDIVESANNTHMSKEVLRKQLLRGVTQNG